MSNLKDFHSTFLKSDDSGQFYVPLYFDSYQELASVICGLNDNIDLLADLIQGGGAEHKSCEDIGIAIKSVTHIAKQLDEMIYHRFSEFDKLQEDIGD